MDRTGRKERRKLIREELEACAEDLKQVVTEVPSLPAAVAFALGTISTKISSLVEEQERLAEESQAKKKEEPEAAPMLGPGAVISPPSGE